MGEITDLLATLTGKLARWLNIQGNKTCFVIWSLVVIYWAFRSASLGLIVQTGAAVISLGFHIYGYYNWKKKGIGDVNVNNVS